jgi:2-oxoglutarate dehydrogenase E2 component (dihydrolipoamide succinyltransferase)
VSDRCEGPACVVDASCRLPRSGIPGMHKIQDSPVVVVARPMMYLAQSYDHRIVDGREAETFLVRVKEGLEDPQRAILDL